MNEHAANLRLPQPESVVDSHAPAAPSSPKVAPFDEAALQQRTFWSVPEAASFLRISRRSLWRMLADPRSGFPKPRRFRGRTLLARDEVLTFMAKEATR